MNKIVMQYSGGLDLPSILTLGDVNYLLDLFRRYGRADLDYPGQHISFLIEVEADTEGKAAWDLAVLMEEVWGEVNSMVVRPPDDAMDYEKRVAMGTRP